MIKTFTKNDLVRFLYGETSKEENIEIKAARIQDNELDVQMDEFQKLSDQINEVCIKAPNHVINNILEYATKCSKLESA
jgi:hypothetical protein